MTQQAGYPSVEWLPDVDRLQYADYWNDEAEERRKPFWVLDGDFSRMEAYLAEQRLPEQLDACVRLARERFQAVVDGTAMDLGAGSLWAAPHLFRLARLHRLYCVEYSRHRLLRIGPAVLAHYGIPPEKVVLALGDLHVVDVPDASLDLVLMSAAFHHSDRPAALLAELKRVLKSTGAVLLIGEHITEPTLGWRARHMVKYIVTRLLPPAVQVRLFGRSAHVDRFVPTEADLLAGDDQLGDHAYTGSQYSRLFTEAGFRYECLRRPEWPYQAFVLSPSGVR